MGKEIGMNSAYVVAFGLWKDLVPDNEEYPWKVAKEVEEMKEERKAYKDDKEGEGLFEEEDRIKKRASTRN